MTLRPLSDEKMPVGRHALSLEGVEIGNAATAGDLLAVELANDEEILMLGVVVDSPGGDEGAFSSPRASGALRWAKCRAEIA